MDRLSELPDSLIFSFFEFLPMKDVVRTQLLSHRWKNLWTLTPYLNFTDFSSNPEASGKFVNECISRWRGTRVQNFEVLSVYSDVDLLVRFAVDNGVRKLLLISKGELDVPQCLYSCSSLHHLSLVGCSMDIRGINVEWNKLKSLAICSEDVSGHVINQILCGSPLLEEFTAILGETERNTNLCFRSTSLKWLQIIKFAYDDDDDDDEINSQLEIWTPNVETLKIGGSPYAKCLLMNVSSLTEAALVLYAPWRALDSVAGSLRQILPAIRHVKRLTLGRQCIKALVNMKSKGLLSPLPNVKHLTLLGRFEEHEQILDLLEVFPKLKTLVIEEQPTQFDAMSKSNFKFEPDPSKPFLEELTTVDVTCTSHDCSTIPFIKSLLKHASKLEKMMLRVKGTPPPSLPVEELLSLPRSSPTAELIFCD